MQKTPQTYKLTTQRRQGYPYSREACVSITRSSSSEGDLLLQAGPVFVDRGTGMMPAGRSWTTPKVPFG